MLIIEVHLLWKNLVCKQQHSTMTNKVIPTTGYLIFLFFFMLLTGCSPSGESELKKQIEDLTAELETALNRIEQLEGKASAQPDERQDKVFINNLMEGRITKLYVQPGDSIQKGQKIYSITGKEFIILQENYLLAQAELKHIQNTFKRQGELTLENASSIKKMQEIIITTVKASARVSGTETRLMPKVSSHSKLCAQRNKGTPMRVK